MLPKVSVSTAEEFQTTVVYEWQITILWRSIGDAGQKAADHRRQMTVQLQ